MTLDGRPSASPVEYLVERRFPGHKLLLDVYPPIGRGVGSAISAEHRRKKLEAVKEYRRELLAKPPEEIQALFEREVAIVTEAALAQADREEQARTFNKPEAKADFSHWSKAAYWTLDEALALAFGRDPYVVTWKVVEPYKETSKFAKEFARARDLIVRAKNWGHLYEPASPGFFLAWALRSDLPVPEALIGEVEARGNVISDWRDAYDKSQANLATMVADRDKLASLCTQLIEERDKHKTRASELEDQSSAWQFDEDDQSYPQELDIAMQAWRAASTKRDPTTTPKQQVMGWLEQHYPGLLPEQRGRISMICNWEKQGGRPPTVPKPKA